MIDNRAIIDPTARIAEGVTIEPWAFIGPDVEIGAGTWVGHHAVIKGPTSIGENNKIFQFSSVGDDPQDKKYQGEKTYLKIGDRNVVREYCTINRGTEQGGKVTQIGDDNLFMAYVHIAHDCIVGNNTVFANCASLAGHVSVQDWVILSGFSGVSQFCTLGAHSFIAKGTLVTKDVPPYIIVSGGRDAAAMAINTEGLRRRHFSDDTIAMLKEAYRIIYQQNLTIKQVMDELEKMLRDCPEIQRFIDFFQHAKRGIVR